MNDATGDRRAIHHEVLVVGGGQSGLALGYFLAQQGRDFLILEAADEPAAAWREHWDSLKLFTPVRYSSLPGRDLFWYLQLTGLIGKTTGVPVGRRMAGRDTLIGSRPGTLRRRHGVRLHGRAVDVAGRAVTFIDGGARGSHGDLGDGAPGRPLMDPRPERPPPPSARSHGVAGPLLPRPLVAPYAGLRAHWVGKDDAEYLAHEISRFHQTAAAKERTAGVA